MDENIDTEEQDKRKHRGTTSSSLLRKRIARPKRYSRLPDGRVSTTVSYRARETSKRAKELANVRLVIVTPRNASLMDVV